MSLTAKETEELRTKMRDGILAEFRTGKVDPAVNLQERVMLLRASTEPEYRSLLSLYELASRTKSEADRKAFAERYADVYAKKAIEAFGEKGTPTVNEKPTEKPIDQANVERRVADYNCRGHWWDYVPGFWTFALVGSVAGLVRRAVK